MLAAYAFILVPVQQGAFGLEQIFYLAVSILVVAPFLVRDLRKSRRRIVLREDGLRELNGGVTSLPFDGIGEIIVRSPLFGSGSVVVHGKEGAKLFIPLGLESCGEFLFLLNTRSQTKITYGQGYGNGP
jgi:hypothetical protein